MPTVVPATGGPTVTVTGTDVSLCEEVVQVTIARNCVVCVMLPEEIPGVVCTDPRFVQLVPSVDDCHWYSNAVAIVLPVRLRLALPSHAIEPGEAVDVPAVGVPVHGNGGDHLYIWPVAGLSVIDV